ncbi:uncharacterized protein METZ01_LOCUS376966 [marine metagenome]|uniref:Uncharacterized protein n=1 Tax=marine metagenome TaxID=408172 RepID=A0A382TQU0_9ZZZZ
MTEKKLKAPTITFLENEVILPSNKKFGLFFSTIFFLIGGYAFYNNQIIVAVIFLVVSCALLLISFVAADYLIKLNILWFKLGILISRVVSPIVLGLIFFVLISPIAILTRMFGRDILQLKKKVVSSYWIKREPRGPLPESFKKQF